MSKKNVDKRGLQEKLDKIFGSSKLTVLVQVENNAVCIVADNSNYFESRRDTDLEQIFELFKRRVTPIKVLGYPKMHFVGGEGIMNPSTGETYINMKYSGNKEELNPYLS